MDVCKIESSDHSFSNSSVVFTWAHHLSKISCLQR